MSREVHVRFRESPKVKSLRATRLCQGVAARYAMMKEMRLKYPVPLISRLMGVSASGYYSWLERPLSKWAREEARLEIEIKAAHKRTRQTYGPERLQRDLAEHDVRVGICRIRRIRKKLGIHCKQKHKFKATTDSRHKFPVAENLLGQEFKVAAPNQVWLSDITYVPTDEGWLYLAGHKDLFHGEVVGYAMGERMSRNLVSQSLFRAVVSRRPAKGLVHHSDRGSQYCAREYRALLEQFGMKASMSRKGNCFDNAPMESFWGSLKQELVYHRRYRTRREAIQDITEYIEIFYNRQRRQARLGYLSPAAYEQRFYSATPDLTDGQVYFLPRHSKGNQPEPAGQSRASESSDEVFTLDGTREKAILSVVSRQKIRDGGGA